MSDGYTPLKSASREGHLDIVKILLAGGANVNASGYRDTDLQAACSLGKDWVIKDLLAHINNQQWNLGTALKMAARKGHIEVVRALLSHGASVSDSGRVYDYETALKIASDKGHSKIMQLLCSSRG